MEVAPSRKLHDGLAINEGLLGAAQHDRGQNVAQPLQAALALAQHGCLPHELAEGRSGVEGLVAQEDKVGEELLGAVLQRRPAHHPPLLPLTACTSACQLWDNNWEISSV